MAKLQMISAAALALAALVAPTSAHADGDYRFGRGVPLYPYAGPAWAYELGVPGPYYDREYRRAEKRAEREYRRQLKREAKAYDKLRRAYERYQFEFGDPYGVAFGSTPYQLARDEYRFLRRLKRDDDDWDDD